MRSFALVSFISFFSLSASAETSSTTTAAPAQGIIEINVTTASHDVVNQHPLQHPPQADNVTKKTPRNLPDPVSHEAEYSVAFVPVKGAQVDDIGPEYSGASGTMTLQMVRFDNNWITKQTSSLRMGEPSPGETPEVTSTILNTFEDPEGLNYEFTAQAMRDGVVEEEISGKGRLVDIDGPGTVVYEKPEPQSINLPHGTVFPITHLKMLLSKALEIKGKNIQLVKAYVFDGSNDVREAVRIHAMIAPIDAKKREVISSDKEVYKVEKLWRAEMSIFTSENTSDDPDYTIVQIFSDQGVIHELRVNYGGYEMVSKLTRLKVYKGDEAAKTLRLVSFNAISEQQYKAEEVVATHAS